MSGAIVWLGYSCILLGAVFALIGAIGLLRLKDTLSRMHAVGVKDALGVPLVLIGLMLLHGWTLMTAKLLILLIFLLFTGPTATHALAQSIVFLKRKGEEQ